MIVWAFVVVVLAILSYLGDVGVISILYEFRYPPLGASQYGVSLMSTLLMLCGLGMMASVGYMARKREKEKLKKQVHELEEKLEQEPPTKI